MMSQHVPIEPIPLVPVTLPVTLAAVNIPVSSAPSEIENGQFEETEHEQETQKVQTPASSSASQLEPPPPQKFKKLSLEDQRYYVPIFHDNTEFRNLHQLAGIQAVSLYEFNAAELQWNIIFPQSHTLNFWSVKELRLPKNMDHKWKLSRLGKFFPGVKKLAADDINNYGLLNTFGEVWPLLEHLDVTFQACGPKLDSVLTGFPQEKCDKLIASGLTPKNISQVLLPDGPSIRTLKELKHLKIYNRIVKVKRPPGSKDDQSYISGITDVTGYFGISHLRNLNSLELIPNDLSNLCRRALINSFQLKKYRFGDERAESSDSDASFYKRMKIT